MLVEKEVIRPGIYWYRDEQTGIPRRLVATPELTRYWHEQGSKMLSAGLTIPVPCEHDFNAHPMTPADKLKNNAGWVKEYRLKEIEGKDGKKIKDVLFSVVDVTDDDIRKKLPHTIRWTSPWINSFTDGEGRQWNNVISHLALTTRPRIINQQPFGSVAAALSMSTEAVVNESDASAKMNGGGFCLSRAGRIFTGKKSKRLRPRYPLAFSVWAGGVPLARDDMPPMKDDMPDDDYDDDGDDGHDDGDMGHHDSHMDGMQNPLSDSGGDVKMEELLCDLLSALGIHLPEGTSETEFKRQLYEAAMSKIKQLTTQQQSQTDANAQATQANTSSPAGMGAGAGGGNPLIQQEQQPMFMSLEDINKLPDPMKGVALAMYAENQKLRTEMEASKKVTVSLRDAKLKEAELARKSRIDILGRLSPKIKTDLDAMVALPGMALSMGDGGIVLDPMAQTLAVLEKGLADLPRLLTIDQSALSVQQQPKDADALTEERANEIADGFSRMMGATPQKQAS